MIYELCKVCECGYVFEGFVVVFVNIDEFIVIIKVVLMLLIVKQELMVKLWDLLFVCEMLMCVESENVVVGGCFVYCLEGLNLVFGMQVDGLYCLFDMQVQEILQMCLQCLIGFEQDKIIGEYCDVMV